jgi:hypothetical protein
MPEFTTLIPPIQARKISQPSWKNGTIVEKGITGTEALRKPTGVRKKR